MNEYQNIKYGKKKNKNQMIKYKMAKFLKFYNNTNVKIMIINEQLLYKYSVILFIDIYLFINNCKESNWYN